MTILAKKIKNAMDQYDALYTTIFDAYGCFEVNVNFDEELKIIALNGLLSTIAKIINDEAGTEAALSAIETARKNLIV